MEIRKMKLEELKPAPWNPRTITDDAYAGLKNSIERFGCVEPIVYNSQTEHVVGGHQRLRVLLEKGETETDVIIVDLPEVEEKALNVTLNNPHVGGAFTSDLSPVLEEIETALPELPALLRLDALMFDDFSGEDKPGIGGGDFDSGEPPREPHGITCPNCGHKFTLGGNT